jgi:hypothetical protein
MAAPIAGAGPGPTPTTLTTGRFRSTLTVIVASGLTVEITARARNGKVAAASFTCRSLRAVRRVDQAISRPVAVDGHRWELPAVHPPMASNRRLGQQRKVGHVRRAAIRVRSGVSTVIADRVRHVTPGRLAERSMPLRFTPVRSASLRSAPARSALARLASPSSACGPTR